MIITSGHIQYSPPKLLKNKNNNIHTIKKQFCFARKNVFRRIFFQIYKTGNNTISEIELVNRDEEMSLAATEVIMRAQTPKTTKN